MLTTLSSSATGGRPALGTGDNLTRSLTLEEESMPDLLDRITVEIRERLTACRAAVAEYERLEEALRALDGGGGSTPTTGTAPPRAAPRQSGPARRGASRRRAPRGANRDAVLRVVGERPGLTTVELAAVSGVARNTLYALLATMTRRGELQRRELPGGKSGYAIPRG
jgi:IclR-like helix-turn-helix domain-containing protein